MEELIKSKLKEIEEKENIKILHCVESGSRAWGFASPDSDYDVRFIYVRPKEFYLRLDKTRDVIEWQLDDTLDIRLTYIDISYEESGEAAAQTLSEVKAAMKINYFDDLDLIKEQAAKYQKEL